MTKHIVTIILSFISLTVFAHQMSPINDKKGIQVATDIHGSRRDYQKQSRVSYNSDIEKQPVEEKSKPNITHGTSTQQRSGGMRY